MKSALNILSCAHLTMNTCVMCICPLLHGLLIRSHQLSVTNGCIKSSRRLEPNILHLTISSLVLFLAGANWFLAFSEEDDIEMTRRSFDF